LKDLAFELSVPADPAFRGMAPLAVGKYGETLGLAEPDVRALEASLQEAVDLAAGADAGGQIHLDIARRGDQLEMTITAGGTTTTLSRGLA
jgi:anti-sigma regulatory factor (Ser/Thr protein kinase)